MSHICEHAGTDFACPLDEEWTPEERELLMDALRTARASFLTLANHHRSIGNEREAEYQALRASRLEALWRRMEEL